MSSISPHPVHNKPIVERRNHEAEEVDDAIMPISEEADENIEIEDNVDGEAEEEAEVQRPFRDPGMPTQQEIAEHCITHLPPRPWCPHCLRGKGKDTPSLRLKGQFAESLVPRVRLDYAFLTENVGDQADNGAEAVDGAGDDVATENSQTILVMQESECRSVWSYAVDSKGASETWVVHQVCEDLETVGLRDDRVIAKSDQEPSIIDVAKEIARNREGRFGTAIDNSAVGDSDSNGTIERAIQDVQGQCRTMRSALEDRLKCKISLKSPVVPWLVRHAGYLITRCRVRPNGRTAFQVMKGRRSNGKLAEFGEVVHFSYSQD